MMDVYRNFSELDNTEIENKDYRVTTLKRNQTGIVIASPHGGGIEPGTSEVAKAVAADDLSLALFEGIKPKGNLCLHLTSSNFDEPRCIRLVQESDTVVTVHGEKSTGLCIFIGGRDKELLLHIKSALTQHGYCVKTDRNNELLGLSPKNICNRGRHGKGVQLELSAGLRRTFFHPLPAADKPGTTRELSKFAAALREGMITSGRLNPCQSING